jgi:hypothetical protein
MIIEMLLVGHQLCAVDPEITILMEVPDAIPRISEFGRGKNAVPGFPVGLLLGTLNKDI